MSRAAFIFEYHAWLSSSPGHHGAWYSLPDTFTCPLRKTLPAAKPGHQQPLCWSSSNEIFSTRIGKVCYNFRYKLRYYDIQLQVLNKMYIVYHKPRGIYWLNVWRSFAESAIVNTLWLSRGLLANCTELYGIQDYVVYYAVRNINGSVWYVTDPADLARNVSQAQISENLVCCLPLTSDESFGNFAQSATFLLSWFLHNFRMRFQLKWVLWVNKSLRGLSSGRNGEELAIFFRPSVFLLFVPNTIRKLWFMLKSW